MSAVKCRDGQDVHYGESDGEEGGKAPEHAPNPSFWEDFSDGDEAAHAFVSLGLRTEDELQLFPIVGNLSEGLGETFWDGLPESVFLSFEGEIFA